jgi:hypothetical protein
VANSSEDIIKVVRFDNPRFSITSGNINTGINFGLFGFANPPSGELCYTDSQTSRTVQLTYIGKLQVLDGKRLSCKQ